MNYLRARISEKSTQLAALNLVKVSALMLFPQYQEFILAALVLLNSFYGVTQG